MLRTVIVHGFGRANDGYRHGFGYAVDNEPAILHDKGHVHIAVVRVREIGLCQAHGVRSGISLGDAHLRIALLRHEVALHVESRRVRRGRGKALSHVLLPVIGHRIGEVTLDRDGGLRFRNIYVAVFDHERDLGKALVFVFELIGR